MEFQWKKRAVYKKLKQGEATKEKISIARACRDVVRKAAAQLELKPVGDVKGNKKSFYRYVRDKGKTRENVGPLQHGTGDLVTKDMAEAEVFSAAFSSVFTARLLPSGIPGPQRPAGKA